MKIIGIETSGYCGSVAITCDGILLSEILVNTGPGNSERIMNIIEFLLNESGIDKHEIDAVSVSSGPGSFTSLRVGMAVAKAMSYSMGKIISSVSSLDTLAAGVGHTVFDVCPMIDAKRGEVYYKLTGESGVIESEKIGTVADICRKIRKKTLFIGDGSSLYRQEICRFAGANALFMPEYFNLPRASVMCFLSEEKIRSGQKEDAFTLKPNYIRNSSARTRAE